MDEAVAIHSNLPIRSEEAMSKKAVESVAGQYGRPGLAARIMSAVRQAFPEGASSDDLGDFDHFHPGGRAATEALAAAANPAYGSTVLDLGAGLGGPARWLTAHCGCRVTCLDITPEYCEAAEALTAFTGLASLVEVRQGDALHTPFDDRSFDLVWAQNAFMNIEDKSGLFKEIRRVLKPGGKLAFMEVMAGPTGDLVYFPLPWADRPELSFLEPPDNYRKKIEGSDLEVLLWEDMGTWLASLASKPDSHGLEWDVYVDDLSVKAPNSARSRKEGRVVQWRAVCRRSV
jgi:ubiquinone/menaquinone biosynthesis C-methylase UbiE